MAFRFGLCVLAVALGACAPEPAPSLPPRPSPPVVHPQGDGAERLLGSCRLAPFACVDYVGSGATAPAHAACHDLGTWSDDPCPVEDVQGTCTRAEPEGFRSRTHAYPPGTEAIARQACGQTPGGTFTPALP